MEAVLRREGHAVQVVDTARPPKSVEVWRFDVTFVGAPMYAGHYPASLIRFVRAQQEFLQRGVSVFFSVNLAVASHTTDGRSETLPLVERFIEETGWRPTRVELIAGALAYTQYNFFIRLFMRRMARKAGGDTDTSRDHEYTDWPAVERFALEVMDRNRRNGDRPITRGSGAARGDASFGARPAGVERAARLVEIDDERRVIRRDAACPCAPRDRSRPRPRVSTGGA